MPWYEMSTKYAAKNENQPIDLVRRPLQQLGLIPAGRILKLITFPVRWPCAINFKTVLSLVILAIIAIVVFSGPVQTFLRACLAIWQALTWIGHFLSFSSYTAVALSSRLFELRCIIFDCAIPNPLQSAIEEVKHASTLVHSVRILAEHPKFLNNYSVNLSSPFANS
jgi:hypothetical protein